jgi:hypothetical protein
LNNNELKKATFFHPMLVMKSIGEEELLEPEIEIENDVDRDVRKKKSYPI